MPDPNLAQWIFLSAAEYFREQFAAESFTYFVEGEPRATDKVKDVVEFRLDGPSSEEVSRNFWFHNIEVNILISAVKDEDLARIHRISGIVQHAFNTEIPVFRYGKQPGDDEGLIGCLQLRKDFRERAIVLSHFGQLEPNLNILQATVEGHFRLTLCEE